MSNTAHNQDPSHFSSVYSENSFLKRKLTILEAKIQAQDKQITELKRMKTDIDTIKDILRLPVQLAEPRPEKPTYKNTFSNEDDVKVKRELDRLYRSTSILNWDLDAEYTAQANVDYKKHILEQAKTNLPGQLGFHRDDHIKIQLLNEGIETKLKTRFDNAKRRKNPSSALDAAREQRKRRVQDKRREIFSTMLPTLQAEFPRVYSFEFLFSKDYLDYMSDFETDPEETTKVYRRRPKHRSLKCRQIINRVHTLATQAISGKKTGKSSWAPSRTRYFGKQLPKNKNGSNKSVPAWALLNGADYEYDSLSGSESESESEYRITGTR